MLGYTRNLERVGTGKRSCTYSWDAEVHYLHRGLFLGTVTNILGTFLFRQETMESACTDVFRARECVTRVQVVFSVIWDRSDAHLSHSSFNPELSQFIVLTLIWPSSGTFQHHHQLTSADTSAPTFATNFECASPTGCMRALWEFSRSVLGAWSSSQHHLRWIACLGTKVRVELPQRRHCNGARLALHTVHCGLKESRVRNFQQR